MSSDVEELSEVQSAGWRQTLAWLALGLSVFTVLWFLAAALGSKFGLWSWQTGLGTMIGNAGAGIGRFFVGASVVLGAAALIFSLIRSPRKKPFMLSIAALLIAGATAGRWLGFQLNALSLPPIHDVQTNWSSPIMFSDKLMKIREEDGASNPVVAAPVIPDFVEQNWKGFGGVPVAEAQENAEQDPAKAGKDDDDKPYMPINTLRIEQPKAEVLAAAKLLIENRGWELVTEDISDTDETGVLEATHTSGWFGFKDDVAIHVLTGANGESIVDMRSVSRVGLSDLGANAKRVGNFLTDLKRVSEG